MRTYCDTSLLVSAYVRDRNSERAVAAIRSMKSPIPFTPLIRHELRNAIRLCVFRRDITAETRRAVLQDMDDDLRDGVLQEMPLPWPDVWREAEALGARFSERLGVRGMDMLHVAAARSTGATRFLTFDLRQLALAREAGLRVGP